MTIDSAKLLQMLEPAVRPGGLSPAAGVGQAHKAFETKSFHDLLDEASVVDESGHHEGKETSSRSDSFLGLSGLGWVENTTLRQVLNQASVRRDEMQ